MESNPYIIESDDLQQMLDDEDLYIIDTRDALDYNKSHIPKAVNLPEFFTYLSTSETGSLPAMVHHFSVWLGYAGLKHHHRVIAYEDAMDNGYGQSCRARFMLKYFGQEDVKVLHGGFRAWKTRKLHTTHEQFVYEDTDYIANLNSSEIITTEEMLAAINDPNITILDCRDRAEWLGVSSSPYVIDFCPRKGRIPGAKWIEWYRTMHIVNGIPYFRSKAEILQIAAEAGITPESNVFLYCFKGARSSNMLLAFKLAGINNVRSYFNAWNDWSRDPSLPIEEGYPEYM
jgi:thiosulfate/3-mercaptopyruvate sulfurtransferase